MKLLCNLSLALCLGLTAQTAQAYEHEVFITPKGFFPEKIYLSPAGLGITDTIKFRNISGYTAKIEEKTRQCNRWNCWYDTTTYLTIPIEGINPSNLPPSIALSGAFLSFISSSGSELPPPRFYNGNSNWDASNGTDISYTAPPLSCPDNRAFCAPTFANGSENP